MQSKVNEQLFMLRLWQNDGEDIWRASLKKVGQSNEAAQYFHSLESLAKFLKVKNSHKEIV